MTDSPQEISTPEHLTPEHDLTAFDSALPPLDDWLTRRALATKKQAVRARMWSAPAEEWSGTTRWRPAL